MQTAKWTTLSQFLTAAFAVLVLPTMAQDGDPVAVVPAEGTAPEALVQLGTGRHFSPFAFVMDKSKRTLSVWKQNDAGLELVQAVPADFGRKGGDKVSAGDHKTPEGIYFFQEMKEGRELDFNEYGLRAFTLDYPNFFDQLDKKSGWGIWLHAIPDSKSLLRGSRGCVVVRNDTIKKLSDYISLKKTPILIQDAVRFVPISEAEKGRIRWQSWLESWRTAWQEKKLDAYISNYGPSFRSLGMNKEQWHKYKTNLANKYQFIKVEVSEPIVVAHTGEVMIRFLQEYQSDKNSDFGEKTLYLRHDGDDQFRIVGEEWRPLNRTGVFATRAEGQSASN